MPTKEMIEIDGRWFSADGTYGDPAEMRRHAEEDAARFAAERARKDAKCAAGDHDLIGHGEHGSMCAWCETFIK